MAKRKKTKDTARRESAACIFAMIDRVTGAVSLATTALTLLKKGEDDRAFDIALEIEPLLDEANYLLQAAATLRRSQRET